MTANSRRCLPPMVLLLLGGFALGAQKLNADFLWLDELYSLSNMGVFRGPYSLPQVVDSLSAHSPNHVPLYFFLGAGWARLVGFAQLPMRYLSLLFGSLLVAWLYRYAADALNRRTAIAAALLLTTSGFVMMYWHEIRMYTLLPLLMVVHAWLYWRLASKRRANRAAWFFFIATAIAQLYTHVFSVFFFAGLGLQHLIFARRIKQWRPIALAWALSALAFLPYLPGYLRGAMAERTIASLQQTALSAPEIARHLAHIAVNGVELLWLPLLALAGLALWKGPRPGIMRLLAVWAGIILSLLLFNEFFPLIDKLRFRFFLAAMPFFVMLCASFLSAPGRWRLVALPFMLLWIAGGLHIHSLGDRWSYAGRNTLFADIPPLHRYADSLRNHTRELDMLVGFSRSKFVDWPLRHDKSIADYYFGAILKLDHAFLLLDGAEPDLPRAIGRLIDDHPYLLLAHEPDSEPPVFDQTVAIIEADYAACAILVDEARLFVRRYVDKSLACDRAYQPIHFENGIKILDKFGAYDRERDALRLVTGWEVADAAQLGAYNVSFQIITPDWQRVGQAPDRHLHDGILKWHRSEISTAELSPGEYRAVVILYDRYSKAKAAGVDLATGERGTIFPILEFSVSR